MSANSSTLFWITSRAAGTTALVLASAAVGVGLTMGGKLIRGGGADRRSLHEILSLSTMVAIAVHGLALLGDTYFAFTPLNVAVPFLAPYRNLFTSVGIVAGWGMVILGLSYYVRRRIGLSRWKTIHRFTAVAWLLGLIHAFADGTDAGKLWFVVLIALTAAPAMVLLIVRHGRRGAPAPSGGRQLVDGGRRPRRSSSSTVRSAVGSASSRASGIGSPLSTERP
jgi:sulfoxide reductase heme-binding subunit YedZ